MKLKSIIDLLLKLVGKLNELEKAINELPIEEPTETPMEEPIDTPTEPTVSSDSGDELDWSKVDSFGSPNVGKAVKAQGCSIKGLRVTGSGLSYQWAEGDCRTLDKGNSHDNPNCLAVMGYEEGGRWKVAKADWISSDRTTRDLKNVMDGYNGFSPSKWNASKKHCFFICDKNGKHRTNVLVG